MVEHVSINISWSFPSPLWFYLFNLQRIAKFNKDIKYRDASILLSITLAWKIVKRIANRAQLSQTVIPHILRHTFATLALQKGIALAAVQKILGHDRLATTAICLNFTDAYVIEDTYNSSNFYHPDRLKPSVLARMCPLPPTCWKPLTYWKIAA